MGMEGSRNGEVERNTERKREREEYWITLKEKKYRKNSKLQTDKLKKNIKKELRMHKLLNNNGKEGKEEEN